jgi:N-carbamoyl-L-amino-acid hydrolase
MFELHIEQGPILEDEHRMVGIVQGVQGMRWYEVTVTGQEAHTGATPMRLRKNALLGAARMIERIDAIALEHAPNAVGAVGLIENKPNSRNVVPGEVFFTIDFRHPEDKVLDVMESKLRASLAELLPPLKLTYKEECIWNLPAVKFAPELIECVRIGTQKAGYSSRDIISGAGHDAAYVARVAPTTMIFVPCAGGISQRSGIDELRGMCGWCASLAQRRAGIRPQAQLSRISTSFRKSRGRSACGGFRSCRRRSRRAWRRATAARPDNRFFCSALPLRLI